MLNIICMSSFRRECGQQRSVNLKPSKLHEVQKKKKKKLKYCFPQALMESKWIPFLCPVWSFWPHEHPCMVHGWPKSPKPGRTPLQSLTSVSHWHGGGNGSTPTLLKGRGKLLSVSPGQQSGISPSGFLGRWRKKPAYPGLQTESSAELTFVLS